MCVLRITFFQAALHFFMLDQFFPIIVESFFSDGIHGGGRGAGRHFETQKGTDQQQIGKKSNSNNIKYNNIITKNEFLYELT